MNLVTSAFQPCAVLMEYEVFSASKLPMSYKAAVVKRVKEIKTLTELGKLHDGLIPCTEGEGVGDITATHMSKSSPETASSFRASSSDVTVDCENVSYDVAVKLVPDTDSDKDGIALSSVARKSKLFTEIGERCDILKCEDQRELCGAVESQPVIEAVASGDFVGNLDFQKTASDDSFAAPDYVVPAHIADHSSEVSFSTESNAANTTQDAAGNKSASKLRKSVRISDSPPTVSYINRQCKDVCNGGVCRTDKVSIFCSLWF